MLSLGQTTSRHGRREFLRAGGLALGGWSLADLFRARAGAAPKSNLVTGKSVIFLFLHGGPSQIETFDPKPDAPVEIRSATGEIATRTPGVTYGASFPQLAALSDKFSVVRSFTTGDGNHDIKPIVGRGTAGANLGSLYSRVAGASHPKTGLPTNAALFPQAVDSTTGPPINQFGKFEATGALGTAYAPFVPGAQGDLQRDMQLTLPMDRVTDRRGLLGQLDVARRTLDRQSGAGLDPMQEQAFNTILGGAAGAFDLANEDPRVIARYDTAPLVRPDQISKRWNNYNHYVDNAKSLGKLLLLARRLCQAGCGFVTVTTSFVWDMHADVNNATMTEGMSYMGPPLDHAVSALIEDLESQGLAQDILLVCCGEMGRTPRLNKNGGRDHWGGLAPLLIYGGGYKMGQTIGQSTRDAGQPSSEPVTLSHVISTTLQTLIDPGELRVTRGVPQEILQAASASPIPGLA